MRGRGVPNLYPRPPHPGPLCPPFLAPPLLALEKRGRRGSLAPPGRLPPDSLIELRRPGEGGDTR